MKAAPLSRMLLAQAAMELRLLLRRGEGVLVTLVVPPVLLAFMSSLPGAMDRLRLGESAAAGSLVTLWLPSMLGLAVMSTSMVSTGISTAFERSYGVLKRLGGSPLPRSALIAAKLLAVLVVEALQALTLGAVALALGWDPTAGEGGVQGVLLGLAAVLLGTAAFGGLGLWMAGSWRAEATLAGANALYLLLLLFGGIVVPPAALPGPLATLAALTPSAALVDTLRAAFGVLDTPLGAGRVAVLMAWAILSPTLAALTFRWE